MFELSLEENQQAFSTKTIQSLEENKWDLEIKKLVEPITLFKINKIIQEIFEDWAHKDNTEGGSKNMLL